MQTAQPATAAPSDSGFTAHFFHVLKSNRFNNYKDNYDMFYRGIPPVQEGVMSALKGGPAKLLAFLKQELELLLAPKRYFSKVLEENKKFAFIYENLCDQGSRDLLVKLLAYRALGFRKIKLPRNNPQYWDGRELARTLDTGVPPISIPFLTWPLYCFDTIKLGFDMRVYTYAEAISINFVQKQYIYDRDGVVCKVEPGDVVIDAGGCWGDTSLQFACEAGSNGHVYTFEFVPSNVGVLRKNLEINPRLAQRITLVQNPVGAESGGKMFFLENGPASRVASTRIDDRHVECEILSIDGLVAQQNIRKVDFIKMDIEGSELDALKGAEDTIRKFRPKLAICVYHKPDDYLAIPQYLNNLNLGYRFYIDHHTIFLGETILFAVPERRYK